MLRITVYVDIIFLINWIANFFVLYVTGKVAGRRIILWKVVTGAAFGAVLLVILVLWPSMLMGIKGVLACVGISMGTVAIPYWEKGKSFVRTWFLSTTIMVLTGSLMNYMRYLFQLSVKQMSQWLFWFTLSGIGIVILTYFIKNTWKQTENLYLIQIVHGGKTTVERVYMDTGNMLTTPIFQKPVMVLSEAVVHKCLNKEEKIIIEQYRQNKRLDYSSLITCQIQRKDYFHEIRYSSVGNQEGRLLCFLMDEVHILGCNIVLCKQPVALVPEHLFHGKEYQGLLHRECIEQRFGGQ
ncbi:MAG: sigma-E processing peptidase SpoIIGA [Lachnospiraceae bacterium]|nr:sigma-E processing peptidase SpoIIGA [Lachnospiraceae bacterium]